MRRKKTIQCRDVDRLLEAYLDGGLKAARQTAVTHHLHTCANCQQLVAAERQRVHRFARLGERPLRLSPAESARLRTAVNERVRRRTMLRQGIRFLRSGAGLALFCVAVLVGLLWWQRQHMAVETPLNPDDVTTITFAAFESQRGGYERRMADFNAEYPQVRVQFVPLDDVPVIADGTRYDRRAIASLADTAVLPPTNAAEAGFFLDLEPLIDTDPAFNAADFWPGALDGCRRGERLIGVPTQISFNYLFYDGAAFDAAGLPHPEPGWTWSEFATAAAALTERAGKRTTRYGFVPNSGAGSLLSSLTDPLLPGAEGALNIEQLVGATNWYVQLIEAGAMPTFAESAEPWQAANELIEYGEAAMWVDFQGNLSRWQQTLGEKVGAAPFPVNEANAATTPATAGCVSASVGTAHPEEAWLWLSYLTRNPVSGSTRTIPARQSVAQAIPVWQEELNAPNSTLAYAVAHAWYGQNNPEGLDVVVGAIEDAAVSNTDLDAAIAAIGTLPPQPTAASLDAPIVVATPFPTLAPAAESDKTIIAFAPSSLLGEQADDQQVYARVYEEQYPDIEIAFSYEPFEEARNLRGMDAWTRFHAHYYDCFSWFPVPLPEHPSELFYSLEPFLAADETGLRDDFQPGLLDSLRVDGELYMLPLTVSPVVLFYNATQFSLLGLPEPTAEMSVDELLALAQTAVTAADDNTLVGWTPWGENGVDYLLRSRGAVPFDLTTDPPQVYFDHPDTVSAARWLLAQSDAGALYFPYAEGPGSSPRLRAIQRGESVLWTTYVSGFTLNMDETPFRQGTLPLPVLAEYAPPVSTNGLFISRRAANPQACWDWMVFLTENLAYGNNMPARPSIMASAAWETAVGPERAELYRTIAAQTFPPEDIWGETDARMTVVSFWLGQALKVAQEGTDVAEALAEAQRQAETYLACMAETPDAGVAESEQCQEQLGTSWLAPSEE